MGREVESEGGGRMNFFSLFNGAQAVGNEAEEEPRVQCLLSNFPRDAHMREIVGRTGSAERKHAIGRFKQCNACLQRERTGVNLAKATLK